MPCNGRWAARDGHYLKPTSQEPEIRHLPSLSRRSDNHGIISVHLLF